MVKLKDNRLRTHCRLCKKRVNLAWQRVGNKIRFMCPNCGGSGELTYKKFKKKKHFKKI